MLLSSIILGIFTFVQLNCENLFDCRHDSLKQDTEFLPGSGRHWTWRRYRRKLDNISRGVISCGMEGSDWSLPDMVALCEVENDSVMRDLTRRSLLRNAGYDYVMTQSPDLRGIDVALMYSPFSFAPICHYPLRVPMPKAVRPTRDILYVCGRLVTDDTLHVFVLHAPSRYGGEKQTRPYRMLVAERVGGAIDSLRRLTPEPNIIVAGDFNDECTDDAVVYLRNRGLTDVSCGVTGRNGAKGTYKYRGRWSGIDHILVSGSLKKWFKECVVNYDKFLLEDDGKYGGVQPKRCYIGYKYNSGYSDHLPLTARFILPRKGE